MPYTCYVAGLITCYIAGLDTCYVAGLDTCYIAGVRHVRRIDNGVCTERATARITKAALRLS